MTEQDEILEVGSSVVFTGFTGGEENAPANAEHLEEGGIYTVVDVDDSGEDGTIYTLEVPNKDFNAKKKPSKDNPETVTVECFYDEVEAVEDEDADAIEGESEEMGEEVEFDKIESGMNIAVVDASGEVVAEGEVTKKLKGSFKIGEQSYKPAKGTTFHIVAEEEEGEEEESEDEVELTPNDFTVPVDAKDVKKGELYLVRTKDDDFVATVTNKTRAKVVIEDEEGSEEIALKDVEGFFALPVEGEEKAEEKVEEKAETKGRGKKATKDPKPETKKLEEDEEDSLPTLSLEEEDEEVVALVSEKGVDLAELIKELEEDIAHKEWLQGGVIYHVRKSKKYKLVDGGKYDCKGGWADYCKDVLGIQYRKAMDLATIYATFQKHGISRDKMAEMGWSKAAKIAVVMDEENKSALVELAEQSIRELNASIKESFSRKGSEKRPLVKRMTFTFRLQEDAGNTVQDVLERAKQVLGETSGEAVFEHIVMQWAGDHLDNAQAATATKGAANVEAAQPTRRATRKTVSAAAG